MGEYAEMAYKDTGLNIWVVDQSQFFRRLEAEYASKSIECSIVEQMDIFEALRRFACDNCPDVLIIDIQQPKVNAIKLVNKLKDKFPQMSVVISSAEAKRQSKYLHGMALICKPIGSLAAFSETMRGAIYG